MNSMNTYNKFSPYQNASSALVNENFDLVQQGLTNTCARDGIATTLMKGDINLNGKTITGINPSNDTQSAQNFGGLTGYVTVLSTTTSTFNFGAFKTVFCTTNQSSIVFNVTIDPTLPMYVYTIITDQNSTITSFTLTNGTVTSSSYKLNPSASKSFVFANNQFIPYNNSLNIPLIDSPNIDSPNIDSTGSYSVFNSAVTTNTTGSIALDISSLPIKQTIGIELIITAVSITTPDPASVYILRIRTSDDVNNSSFSNVYYNQNSGTIANQAHIINSARNPLGSVLGLNNIIISDSYTYFSYNKNINYYGYSLSNSTSNSLYNTYGGLLPLPSNNILYCEVIKKPIIATINGYAYYAFNASASIDSTVSITYNYRIFYQHN